MLWSDRGISLVYQGRQGSTVRSILTVESYIKWYNIFVVSPDRVVTKLPRELAQEYQEANDDIAWSDHLPLPEFCEWLGEKPQYQWDEPSLDMIYGRWQRERS